MTEKPIRPVRPPSIVQAPSPPAFPRIAPPPPRIVPSGPAGEVAPTRDVARLLRYGEVFGEHRIELQHFTEPLVITSGRIVVGEISNAKRSRELARRVAPGKYRVMQCLAIAGTTRRLAALVVHVGHPPIARWVVAHAADKKPPKTAADAAPLEISGPFVAAMDALCTEAVRATASGDPQPAATTDGTRRDIFATVVDATSGRNVVNSASGAASLHAYWALDPKGDPVCLVLDLDIFKPAEWRKPKGAK